MHNIQDEILDINCYAHSIKNNNLLKKRFDCCTNCCFLDLFKTRQQLNPSLGHCFKKRFIAWSKFSVDFKNFSKTLVWIP